MRKDEGDHGMDLAWSIVGCWWVQWCVRNPRRAVAVLNRAMGRWDILKDT